MNKKCTFLATAFLTVGTFMAHATDVAPEQWTAGNYYYLQAEGDKCLSLAGNKADSVIVKKITPESNKASRDSALWEITEVGTETATVVYQIKNKKTKQVLSFPASATTPVLGDGINKWAISGGKISANGGKMVIGIGTNDAVTFNAVGTSFSVEKPNTMIMSPQDLGGGFSVFQLKFGGDYQGADLFADKDLIATSVSNDKNFMTLQVKDDESFPNGVKKYLGVDTLKTEINDALDVFGAKFALDSTRTVVRPNGRCQHFKFVIDLQNDSLSMFVAGAPDVNGDLSVDAEGDTVCIVYAQVADTKVLTVSKFDGEKGQVKQGFVPLITVSRGTPATISSGTGVYFLKNAGTGANAGKYYIAQSEFMGGDSVPSVNKSRGQWYIKEDNGKYSIVDRQSGSYFTDTKDAIEIFAVQGMENTYLFGNDSVTILKQVVNLDDKYLGSMYFTAQELNDKAFVLNIIPGASGVSLQYASIADSILRGSDDKDIAAIFKLIPSDTLLVGGATALDDYLYVISYKLRGAFNLDTVSYVADKNILKLSDYLPATSFAFISDASGEKYSMVIADNKDLGSRNVSMNFNTANLEMTDKEAYVALEAVEAPEYASFADAHKRLVLNNNSLVMNPYTFFAEFKKEGNEITKAGYEEENFSLWVEQDKNVDGKQLYFISSGMKNGTNADKARYYLSAKDTLGGRAMFLSNDTIKTMKNSPALFAFKTAEQGGYYLENQSELAKATGGKPYLGVVNGFATMQSKLDDAVFTVENAPAPTANEEVSVSEVQVLSKDGEVIVANAAGKKITLSSILGQTIDTRRASSDYFSIPVSTGIVLVTVEGNKTYKVVVK